jgi:hypothetical protein
MHAQVAKRATWKLPSAQTATARTMFALLTSHAHKSQPPAESATDINQEYSQSIHGSVLLSETTRMCRFAPTATVHNIRTRAPLSFVWRHPTCALAAMRTPN